MVQKYLVDYNHHHQMINILCYMVYVAYFYFVEKMGNHVEGVDYLKNLLNWSMYLGDPNNGNIRDLIFEEGGGVVDLFFVGVHNCNCVLQKCFL